MEGLGLTGDGTDFAGVGELAEEAPLHRQETTNAPIPPIQSHVRKLIFHAPYVIVFLPVYKVVFDTFSDAFHGIFREIFGKKIMLLRNMPCATRLPLPSHGYSCR